VAPNAYMMLRPDLVIVGCNDAYVAAVGRTRDTFVGQPLFEAFPADPHSESYRLLRHSIDRVLHTLETDHIAFIPMQWANRRSADHALLERHARPDPGQGRRAALYPATYRRHHRAADRPGGRQPGSHSGLAS
jgi:PAS domain-containing protein